jgi:hypothetical protein
MDSVFQIDSAAFECVAEEALREWPDVIDVHQIERFGDRYSVMAIFDMMESRCELHNREERAMLMSQMHHAIYIVLHHAARYVTVLRPREMRIVELQRTFTSQIMGLIERNDFLDWSKADFDYLRSAVTAASPQA